MEYTVRFITNNFQHIALSALSFSAFAIILRAFLCDIFGFDVITRKKMDGNDVIPLFWGEPNTSSPQQREYYLISSKRVRVFLIYPLSLVAFGAFGALVIKNMSW